MATATAVPVAVRDECRSTCAFDEFLSYVVEEFDPEVIALIECFDCYHQLSGTIEAYEV